MNKTDQQLVALAGIYQASALVNELAQKGQANNEAIEQSIYSLFEQNPQQVEDVFGGLQGVKYGLRAVQYQFQTPDKEELEVSRYSISLIHLAGKLLKDKSRLQQLDEGIKAATEKLSHYGHTHINQLAALADLYKQTISTLLPQIMIKGEPIHLQNPNTQNQIRALLLAGIRAAVLWKQIGGSRVQLLFRRKHIAQTATRLLQQNH